MHDDTILVLAIILAFSSIFIIYLFTKLFFTTREKATPKDNEFQIQILELIMYVESHSKIWSEVTEQLKKAINTSDTAEFEELIHEIHDFMKHHPLYTKYDQPTYNKNTSELVV